MAQLRLLLTMLIVLLALGSQVKGADKSADTSAESFFDRMTGQGTLPTMPASQKADHNAIVSGPPTTPPGLPSCTNPMILSAELPRNVGETIRYVIEVNGLSVGTIDFRVERRGTLNGTAITEYRSLFKISDVVATLLPVEGRAAALVADATFWPMQAMNRYKIRQDEFDESQTFSSDGRHARSHRIRNGKTADDSRAFPGPAQDFVTGFYLMRSLPAGPQGCAILYGNQRAYTAWVTFSGDEQLMTPVGLKPSRRYDIRFASDKAKAAAQGTLWMSTGADRIPYKAELLTGTHLVANVHLYETGQN